jgi:hypothetical protein
MCSACKLGTVWGWLLKAETYVGAIDSVYENMVHMLVLTLWFVIKMHGEYNVKPDVYVWTKINQNYN